MTAVAGWTLTLEVPKEASDVFARALEPLAAATSLFETADPSIWRIEIFMPDRPDDVAVVGTIALAARLAGVEEPEVRCAALPATDWVSENQQSFQPITAGRFFVHPSHFDGRTPAGATALAIDAGPAFGTGAHGSTLGCLLALDRLSRRGPPRGPVLDLGCGSGILSLAVAKRWHRPVLATDIDPFAVRTTRVNATGNGMAPLVRAIESNGLKSRELQRRGPYDLILANILARPLIDMARDIRRHLAPRGTIILSGFMPHQASAVRAAYRRRDYHLVQKEDSDGWTTFILARFGGR